MGLLQVKSQGGASNSSKYFKIGIVKPATRLLDNHCELSWKEEI